MSAWPHGADVRGDCTGEAAAGSNPKNGIKLFRRPKFSILIILAAVPLHWKLAAAISLSFNKQQLDKLDETLKLVHAQAGGWSG